MAKKGRVESGVQDGQSAFGCMMANSTKKISYHNNTKLCLLLKFKELCIFLIIIFIIYQLSCFILLIF